MEAVTDPIVPRARRSAIFHQMRSGVSAGCEFDGHGTCPPAISPFRGGPPVEWS